MLITALCVRVLTAPVGYCLPEPPVQLSFAEYGVGVPVRLARVSHYDPALCALGDPGLWTNCYDPTAWWRMGDGGDARRRYDRAIACPNMDARRVAETGKNWYGRRLYIPGVGWRVCRDAGGAIVEHADGSIVIDVLTSDPIDTSPRWGYWLEVYRYPIDDLAE